MAVSEAFGIVDYELGASTVIRTGRNKTCFINFIAKRALQMKFQNRDKEAEDKINSFSTPEEKKIERKIPMLPAIVDSSNDAIISKTLDGTIISWNPAATRLFGYEENEVLGKNISVIIPPDSLAEEDILIENILKGSKIQNLEAKRISRDGSEKLVLLSASPITNSEGNIVAAATILRDISERNNQEEKQAILAAIVNSSDDAIISKTLDGIITSWNASATRLFGFTEEEAVGKHISLIIPKDRMDEEARIIESLRRGEKIDHFETIRESKDGTLRNISLTISPITNSRGKIIGASKIARDISMRIEAEKQRAFYTKRLQQLNKYKDEFMVMASHELKTPLTVITANLQIMLEMMKGTDNVVFVEKVLKQVDKLSELITNLLDVSKIVAGKLELKLVIFDLNDLLAEQVANLQQTTSRHKIFFDRNPQKLMVSADREKIEQVIINILNNAIKYSRANQGDIYVSANATGNKIQVDIKDEGIGIPKKDIRNIFLRFFRVRGSASSFSGSGVGLYICSEIIKRHKGKIWVESKFGEGSTFHFTLPGLKGEKAGKI
jgi:PAS domain S-box-containing protein